VYQFTPDQTGAWSVRTCSPFTFFDTIVSLRGGTCTSGSQIACNDDFNGCTINDGTSRGSRVAPLLSAGQTYYIVVDGFGGAAGNFLLTVAPATACDFVTDIPGTGGTFDGSTTGASPLSTACGGSGPARVFRFTPDVTKTYEMRTCGSGTDFDTVVSIRQGDCDGGADIDCDDDGCFSPETASTVTEFLTAGQTYYIIVNGFGGAAGNFSLYVGDPIIG
jgi:hypothetical protein